MVGLGDLPGGVFESSAEGVSADGTIVLGKGMSGIGTTAFVWDEIRGMQNLRDLLVGEFGFTNLSDWELRSANAISADGQTIVGYGTNPSGYTEAWRAYIDGVTRSWIGTNNNSWDQPGNWTKWGKPGPQTTVVINSDHSFTVAGPADEAFVDSLTLGASTSGVATLTLDGPCLNVTGPINVQARGKLDHNAGILSAGEFYNAGSFNQSLGTSLNVFTFENSGTAVLGGHLMAYDALENQGDMTIQADAVVEVGNAGLLNVGALTLEGGTIAGSGGVTNTGSGQMTARGTLSTMLTNLGVLELSGTLSVEGASTNWGRIVVGSARSYRTGGEFTNAGIVELDGGSIAAAGGSLVNDSGGLIQGRGSISAPTSNAGGLIYADDGLLMLTNLTGGNKAGGELRVGSNSTMNVLSAFASTGLITLESQSARLGGGIIGNSGSIVGCGQISNTVHNSGIIRAENGQLTLSGAANTNTSSGQIQIPFGTAVFFSQGLATNAGSIAMVGGTLDTNNTSMTNGGTLAGNGTIRTKLLTNSGQIKVADANTAFYGAVTNSGRVDITENTTTFYGYVTNNGTIKTTAAMVRFLGGFINSGTYISDPSTQYFDDLVVSESSVLIGGEGDVFIVEGNFLNASTQNAAWNTGLAELGFTAGEHVLEMAGTDQGTAWSGYTDDFSWGVLSLSAGASLVLQDGNDTPGSAQYVRELLLADGLGQIADITGNGLNLYYDPTKSSNDYLLGQSYPLADGGMLIPVPEPGTLALLAAAIVCLAGFVRRGVRKG